MQSNLLLFQFNFLKSCVSNEIGHRFSQIYTDNILIHKLEDLKLLRSSVSKKEMLLLSVYTCPLVPHMAGGSVKICVL